MTDGDKGDYIESVKNRIFFYIEAGFWSKPKMNQLRSWLSNFNTPEGEYYAYKLLDNFVYYSEDDIITLLKYGLEERIFKRFILNAELKTEFNLSASEINEIKKEFLSTTAILPLSDNPSSSGNLICRFLTTDLGFPEEQVLNGNRLDYKMLKKYDRILIVDDFIGTADQLIEFWNYDKINIDGEEKSMYEIKDMLHNENFLVEFEYLCPVVTQLGYNRFVADDTGFRNDLHITYCEMLSNDFIVFGSNSRYFNNEDVEKVKNYLLKICNESEISLLGHGGFNYAIAFHHSIPDCSLPLFYTQNQKWNYLFKNKLTSNDAI